MKTIEIDDDVYSHIAGNTQEIGESASDILRRLLGLGNASTSETETAGADHELADILGSPRFRLQWSVVDKFLFILGEAHRQHKDDFHKVLVDVTGRGRVYFATSREGIEASGKSTQPKRIPDSPYWVMTNSPTRHKAQMLRDVLRVLGYSEAAVRAAGRAIGG